MIEDRVPVAAVAGANEKFCQLTWATRSHAFAPPPPCCWSQYVAVHSRTWGYCAHTHATVSPYLEGAMLKIWHDAAGGVVHNARVTITMNDQLLILILIAHDENLASALES